ncbi:MAG: hypothetical protein ACLFOY_10585 [Desulfatibacillaceae bacterium]
MSEKSRRLREFLPQAVKYAVIVVLLALPIVALGRLMIATEDELDEVRGQALMEFETQTRVITNCYQTDPNPDYSWGYGFVRSHRGNITLEVGVLKLDGQVVIDNLKMNKLGMGYYHDGGLSPENNETYGWDIYMATNIWGYGGYPVIMDGLRVEYARDPSTKQFKFFRVGTDDIRGRIWFDKDGDYEALRRVSADTYMEADVHAPVINDMYEAAYVQRHRQYFVFRGNYAGLKPLVNTDDTNWMDLGRRNEAPYSNSGFHGLGKTDFYISYANLITSTTGHNNNNKAFNPWRPEWNQHSWGNKPMPIGYNRIPGQGWWMSMQRVYADADVSW